MRLAFSTLGAAYLAMLFIPNVFWARLRNRDADPAAQNEDRLLRRLEVHVVLLAAVVVLGVGHVGIHRQHAGRLR